MTIKDCPCRLKLISPLNSPTKVPNASITMNASHGGTPREISDIKPRFVAPIKNGIDKSRPPNITTSVWPIVAKPRNEAKTNIDFIFCRERKPSMETEPIIKRPTKTATPMMTLLLIFKNLYAMKANIKHHTVLDKLTSHQKELMAMLKDERASNQRLKNIISFRDEEIEELNQKNTDLLWDAAKIEKKLIQLQAAKDKDDAEVAQWEKKLTKQINKTKVDN